MENVSPSIDDFYSYYTSAPTSPRKYNYLDGFLFLSMPTSPTRNRVGFESGSITPEMSDSFSPYVDNFEFEGSKRFDPYENRFGTSRDLSIAYADELFCDGKMLPLRPPPRAQCTRPNKGNNSTASSSGGRGSKLKVPFLRQRSLWNDGYDPFLDALNKVKEGNDMVSQHRKKAQLRRSKSLSPFRRPNVSTTWKSTHIHNKMGLSPRKDVLGPLNPIVFRPIKETKEEMGNFESLESRKQRIKKFLLKNSSFGKEVNREKREHKTPLLLRKLYTSQRSCSIIRISREMKSLMKHRARFFYCLAKRFGIKSSKK